MVVAIGERGEGEGNESECGQPTLDDDGGDEGSRGGEDGRQSGVGSGATRGDPKRRGAAQGDPERRRGAGRKEGVRFRLCWGRGSGKWEWKRGRLEQQARRSVTFG
ncbi:unnamed protein product [Linum trigynum]|uniref:Uncharacterized protein n=1 Tax=Linum trigynum TaxID=586398 RepID=A0AAV2FKE4_9ROSI